MSEPVQPGPPSGSAATVLTEVQREQRRWHSQCEWGHLVVRYLRRKQGHNGNQCSVGELLTNLTREALHMDDTLHRALLGEIVLNNAAHLTMWLPEGQGREMIKATASSRDAGGHHGRHHGHGRRF